MFRYWRRFRLMEIAGKFLDETTEVVLTADCEIEQRVEGHAAVFSHDDSVTWT